MNKLAILALFGVANACHGKRGLINAVNSVLRPDRDTKCTFAPEEQLTDLQVLRMMAQTSVQSFTKGFYRTNEDVISDECFGEWVEPKVHEIFGVVRKAREDIWNVSIKDAETAALDIVDSHWKNREVCQFEKIGDDMKNWCLENEEVCVFKKDMEGRILENIIPLAGNFVNLYKLSFLDDTCYTDAEIVAEWGKIVENLGEIAAEIGGFDYKWNQKVERKHISKNVFKKTIREFKKAAHLDLDQKFEMAFPTLYSELNAMANDFVNSLPQPPTFEEMMPQMEQSFQQPSWGYTVPQIPSFTQTIDFEFRPVNMMEMMPQMSMMNSYMPNFQNMRLF